MKTKRFFIELSFKGTCYHGWQIQPNAITVQEVLNDKLSLVLREKINTVGAGRTDTGVHAKHFVAHFDCKNFELIDCEFLIEKMNGFLPADICIKKIYEVRPDIHARFSAIMRTYEYYISHKKSPFIFDYSWYLKDKLNHGSIKKAIELLFEYNDFSCFSKTGTNVKTNHCKIHYARWIKRRDHEVFIICADRFLRNMVRAIVGTLVDIGKENITIEEFISIIEKRDRSNAGASVPPQGLFLSQIIYPDNITNSAG